MLFAWHQGLKIALDTCSEVSIGQIEFLQNVRLAKEAVLVEGVGGMCLFDMEGDFSLGDNGSVTVFAVK